MRASTLSRLLALILAVALVAGCAPSTPAPAKEAAPAAKPAAAPTAAAAPAKPAPADFKMVIGVGAEEMSLDPNYSNSTNWLSLMTNMYDTLVDRDRSGKVVPGLAESWRAIDDTTWEFKLRQGVKFHGGETFVAEDVQATFDHVLDPATKSLQKGYVDGIKELKVVDPATVRITTKEPDPLLADKLQLVPVISGAFMKQKGAAALANAENGTGPYKLVEWVKGDHLTVEAYPQYWRGAPKVKTATFRLIPELSSLTAALQAGEVDIAVNIPPDSAKALASARNFKIADVPSQRSLYIVLDNTVKPLDDVRVRQALNYGIDLKEIAGGLLLGYADPLPSLLGSMYLGYNGNLKPYAYDPEKAKKLLADAGYPNGISITLNAPVGRYVKDKEVAEAIVGQWAKIGVKADLKIHEWGKYMDSYRAHQLGPAYLIGFGMSLWDFSMAFNSYLLPSRPQAYYRNAELQKMSEDALKTVDTAKRKQLLEQINARLYDDAGFVFLYLQKDIYGVSNRIDWTPRSDERIWLYEVAPK